MKHIHKKFTDNQVKELMRRYIAKEIERNYIQEILGIGKARFFALIQSYRQDPQKFSIQYQRQARPNISKETEKSILKELLIEKRLIQNKEIPLKCYNYSYIKERFGLHPKSWT